MAIEGSTTKLLFHYDAKLYTVQTTVEAVIAYDDLDPDSRSLFKQGGPGHYAIVTRETIFHPQGGGQPSDEGTLTGSDGTEFHVVSARMDIVQPERVLHFGHFGETAAAGQSAAFTDGQTVTQSIDVDKRILYSRLHTAGHVLGAAVRHLLEDEVPGFDELKASHMPKQAACEFRGKIEGKWLSPIQERVDEYIGKAMPVEIDWWDAEDFKKNGLERLLPDKSPAPNAPKLRVVKIIGAEVYPCGGTHVDTTDLCGPTKVNKISRSKGTSRVSYSVAEQ